MLTEKAGSKMKVLLDGVLGYDKKQTQKEIKLLMMDRDLQLSREQILRMNHLLNTRSYGENNQVRTWKEPKHWYDLCASFIVKSGILPIPSGDIPVRILSTSANRGQTEDLVNSQLGHGYEVYPSDLAEIKPVSKLIRHYRADAMFLPFKDEFFSLVTDLLGAANYAISDDQMGDDEIQRLFDEYWRVLAPGGKIVFDHFTKGMMDAHPTGKIRAFGFKETDHLWKNHYFRVLTKRV